MKRTWSCETKNIGDKIRFLKREIKELQQEIFGSDKSSRSQYVKEFVREFGDYQEIVPEEELHGAIEKSRLIYVADYHSLPQAQQFAVELLEQIAKGNRVALGVEVFYTRNQEALDQFLRGKISERLFLERIRYSMEWGYDWESYRRIVETCRRLRVPIYGIDCPPRNDLRMIGTRDHCVAIKIADLMVKQPDSKVMIIFGEAHLTSAHLPARVLETLTRLRRRRPRSVTVLQNVDDIYWRLSCEGKENTRCVRVKPNVFCVFTATPYVKYESYYRTLERWKLQMEAESDESVYLTSTLYNLIDVIVEFLGIDRFRHCLDRERICVEFFVDAYPEIYSREDAARFAGILRSSGLKEDEISAVLEHVKARGSCYVSGANAIFVGKFELLHAGEEAAHFVNFACKEERGKEFRKIPRSRPDLFYVQVMEECLGYFGSKLIDPSRDHLRDSLFRSDVEAPRRGVSTNRLRLSYSQSQIIRNFLKTHSEVEIHYRRFRDIPAVISQGFESEGKVYALLVHELGYTLGEKIYRLYLHGRMSRKDFRRLFFMKFDEAGQALDTYLRLARKYERWQGGEGRREKGERGRVKGEGGKQKAES